MSLKKKKSLEEPGIFLYANDGNFGHFANDGNIRYCDILTQSGVVSRPLVKLALVFENIWSVPPQKNKTGTSKVGAISKAQKA